MSVKNYVDDTSELEIKKNPFLYYKLVSFVNSVSKKQEEELIKISKNLKEEVDILAKKSEIIEEAANNFMEESRISMRSKINSFSSLEKRDDFYEDFNKDNCNFIVYLSIIIGDISRLYDDMYKLIRDLRKPVLFKDIGDMQELSQENYEKLLQVIQLNGMALEMYTKKIATLTANKNVTIKVARGLYKGLDQLYKFLLHRHTADGIKIYRHPIITDVAIKVVDNIDSHGEIESGKSTDKVSAYTLRKAEILTKALKDDLINKFISDPDAFITFIVDMLTQFNKYSIKLADVFEPQADILKSMGVQMAEYSPSALKMALKELNNVNPANIVYCEPTRIVDQSQKLIEDAKSETIEEVVDMLTDNLTDFSDIVEFVLERKAELKKFFHEENSFYVCKIGSGNPFLGEAPGALAVLPAVKPRGNIDDILGGGFAEVKEFANSIQSSAKWHDLFVATSPSKSADKSNILMVGPQGCGKTEVLRSIGSQKDSIGIFAQGSDFLTCWSGESQKNPKRLFEAGLKLNRDSGKHVHFLIDEIDAVLNNDSDQSKNNLTLEFQILMDGVVSYPNLSVWGATNNPNRIPMPMIRRFNKVLIVGELSQSDRIALLKHFMSYMPVDKFADILWTDWSIRLAGATGDVIRKIVDYIWRRKMNDFVTDNKEAAEKIAKTLNAKGKFSLDTLDRAEFNKILSEHVKITVPDVEESLTINLSNMAIRSEIDTAVKTYDNARAFLQEIKNK